MPSRTCHLFDRCLTAFTVAALLSVTGCETPSVPVYTASYPSADSSTTPSGWTPIRNDGPTLMEMAVTTGDSLVDPASAIPVWSVARFECRAVDPDGATDTLQYFWHATAGRLEVDGPRATWFITHMMPESVTIRCQVSDPHERSRVWRGTIQPLKTVRGQVTARYVDGPVPLTGTPLTITTAQPPATRTVHTDSLGRFRLRLGVVASDGGPYRIRMEHPGLKGIDTVLQEIDWVDPIVLETIEMVSFFPLEVGNTWRFRSTRFVNSWETSTLLRGEEVWEVTARDDSLGHVTLRSVWDGFGTRYYYGRPVDTWTVPTSTIVQTVSVGADGRLEAVEAISGLNIVTTFFDAPNMPAPRESVFPFEPDSVTIRYDQNWILDTYTLRRDVGLVYYRNSFETYETVNSETLELIGPMR